MRQKFILTFAGITFVLLLMGASCVSFSSNKTGTSGPAGMFVSADKGESWQQISALPKADKVGSISGVSVSRLYEDPQGSRAMYIATPENGLFY